MTKSQQIHPTPLSMVNLRESGTFRFSKMAAPFCRSYNQFGTSANLPDLSGNGNSGTLENFSLSGSSSNWVSSNVLLAFSGIETESVNAQQPLAKVWVYRKELVVQFEETVAPGNIQIVLYDALGKVRYNTSISTQGTGTVDLSMLSAGYYFLHLSTTSGTQSMKVLVK